VDIPVILPAEVIILILNVGNIMAIRASSGEAAAAVTNEIFDHRLIEFADTSHLSVCSALLRAGVADRFRQRVMNLRTDHQGKGGSRILQYE
jgi:hypothetical protein